LKKSKLYSLIQSLGPKEKANLLQFVSSSYFSKEEQFPKALSYLFSTIEKDKELDKAEFFAIFYPDQTYNDTKLRLSQSQLFKLTEKFLKIYHYQSDDTLNATNELFLLKYYRQHNLEKLYNAQASRIKTNFTHKGVWSDLIMRTKLDSAIESNQYNLAKKRQAFNLQEVLDVVDLMYYANKLKFACMALAHQAVFNQDYKLDNLKWVLADINSKQLSTIPLVGAYYHAYHMIREPDNEIIFQYFDTYLKENEAQLSVEDQQTLYLFAINQCIRRLNNGEKQYGLKGLELYERALENGILLRDGHLSRFTYRNIAMMAIRADDLDWAEAFTHKYSDQLLKADKRSAYNFNLALVHYYKGSYNEALSHIQEADFKDPLIHLAAKTLQAKIYYELEADQSLHSLLDSVDIYLIRKKVIGYHRNNYRNIIKYFKKLSRTNPYDREKKQHLAEKIKKEEVLTEKAWLLEKLGSAEL